MTLLKETERRRGRLIEWLAHAAVEPFAMPFRYGRPFFNTLRYDIRQRLAGTLLGYAWLLITPLLFLAFYALTYILIFKFKPPGLTTTEYTLFIFCGLMPYLGFTEGLSAGTVSVRSNRSHLFNTVFPVELLTMRSVLSFQPTFYVGTTLAIILSIAFTQRVSPTLLVIPFVVFTTTLFTIGLSYFMAILGLIMKDLTEVLRFIFMLMLLISPIAFTREMVPPELAALIYLNPLSFFITCLQDAAVRGHWPPMDAFLISTALGFGTYVLGFNFFSRVKTIFIERA